MSESKSETIGSRSEFNATGRNRTKGSGKIKKKGGKKKKINIKTLSGDILFTEPRNWSVITKRDEIKIISWTDDGTKSANTVTTCAHDPKTNIIYVWNKKHGFALRARNQYFNQHFSMQSMGEVHKILKNLKQIE